MTSKRKSGDETLDRVDALIQEILVDAYGEDEQLWAFLQAFEDNVTLPADAFVIGEPVTVTGFGYDGNERRGLTVACQKGTKSYEVALSELVFPNASEGAEYVAAYRAWFGLKPVIVKEGAAERGKRHKATVEDFDLTGTVKLIVLRVKQRAACCRIPGTEREVTLRCSGIWKIVPGEIVTVRPGKQWRYAGHPYLSGEVESCIIDVPGLGLRPLRLYDRGTWDPADEYWGEEDEPVPEWAGPIIARGPRPAFEMEQVIPGADPSELDDPIIRSNELKAAGSIAEARELLLELLAADLRCLDAHAHLGNLVYDRLPEEGLRHYEIGMRIGELSLGESFEGTLNWGWIDNRPYLRCLHGYGLCLWRLKRLAEAESVFQRMLWLNPSDNQGARFLLEDMKSEKSPERLSK
jgi:hypothetical protein